MSVTLNRAEPVKPPVYINPDGTFTKRLKRILANIRRTRK